MRLNCFPKDYIGKGPNFVVQKIIVYSKICSPVSIGKPPLNMCLHEKGDREMKKTISLILCIAMAVSMFAMTAAFAVDDDSIEPKGDPTLVSSYATGSDTDDSGNVYTVIGYVTYAVFDATVHTKADITKHVESETVVSKYNKSIYANGVATYNLVLTDNFGQQLEGELTFPAEAKQTKTYNGMVSHVYGDHGFFCNGARVTFPTQIPTYVPASTENNK